MKTLVALALALAGCKQAKEASPAADVIARSRALSTAMCACTDRACGAKLQTEWHDLTEMLHGATFTEEQVEALATEDDRFSKCMQRLER